MSRRAIAAILLSIFVTGFLPSHAAAWLGANDLELSRILEPSRPAPLAPTCSIVNVHSALRLEDSGDKSVFLQQGIGWVIVDHKQRLAVLTPAHVVTQGQIMYAQCGEKFHPLRLLIANDALDLALLAVEGTGADAVVAGSSDLLPLFWFNAPAGAKERLADLRAPSLQNPGMLLQGQHRAQVMFVESGRESQPKPLEGTIQGSASQIMVLSGHSAVLGHAQALLYHNSGVRPGMSGSPIVVSAKVGEKEFSYILGMIVKSESNGSNALGVPITSIAQLLVSIRDRGDVDGDVVADGVVIRPYLVKEADGSLGIDHELIVTDRVAGKELRFTEVCSEDYPNTSGWTRVSRTQDLPAGLRAKLIEAGYLDAKNPTDKWRGIKIARGRGDYGDTGGRGDYGDTGRRGDYGDTGRRGDYGDSGGRGDYGDSGGDANQPFEFRTFTDANARTLGVLRTKRSCNVKGLRTPWGQVIDSMMWRPQPDRQGGSQAQPIRVDSLFSFARLMGFANVYMRAGVLKAQSIESFVKESMPETSVMKPWAVKEICTALGFDGNNTRAGIWPLGKQIRFQNEKSVFLKSFIQIKTDPLQNGMLQGELMCNRSLSSYLIRSRPQRGDGMVSGYDLFINANGRMTGFIAIGDKPECRVELSNENVRSANMWSHQIRDARLRGNISISHHYPHIRLSLTGVKKECLEDAGSEVFLWEQIWDRTSTWKY